MDAGHRLISTILRHDAKQTSYKIALLRAINDIALSYPDLREQDRDIAIPVRYLAQFWLAYYWPFIDDDQPILQGARTLRDGVLRHDLSFRPALTELKRQWRALYGKARAADGFVLIHDLKLPRKRQGYAPAFLELYDRAVRAIMQAVQQPVQYAGAGSWSIFVRPQRLARLTHVTPVPGALLTDVCLVVTSALWRSFQELSLWIEALCVHEWCLFTERVDQLTPVSRGSVYTLLTERPDNRRPLTWERNGIDLLMLEGQTFTCPWSFRALTSEHYDLDHLVPLAIFPINELWNLVPSDPKANNLKRARLPSPGRWQAAAPHLTQAYRLYRQSAKLGPALNADVTQRFSFASQNPDALTGAVGDFITVLTQGRNLPIF